MLTRRVPLSAILNGALAWAVLFPFVPSVVRTSDTQPLFLLVFLAAVAVALLLPDVGEKVFGVTAAGAAFIAAAVAAATLSIVVSYILGTAAPLPARVFAFVQFAAAAAWAAYGRFEWRGRLLLAAVMVYAAFTPVFFATGGALEDVLIGSRGLASESMLMSGRGARTLSPEPSFFALHMFNLCVLAHVTGAYHRLSSPARSLFIGLACLCMLASFSAYGAVLSMVVLAVTHPRVAIALIGILALALGPVLALLQLFPDVRMVGIILTLLEARGALQTLLFLDTSVSVRFESLTAYVNVFAGRPLLGDGFSLYQGGGFISIVAGLGTPALLFFLMVVARIAVGGFAFGTAILAFAWLAVNGTFGPVGIPALGVIIGTILTRTRVPAPISGATAPLAVAPR
jgi:hypothetical protein